MPAAGTEVQGWKWPSENGTLGDFGLARSPPPPDGPYHITRSASGEARQYTLPNPLALCIAVLLLPGLGDVLASALLKKSPGTTMYTGMPALRSANWM